MIAFRRADPDAEPRTRRVDAWILGAGTELPGLVTVADVQRDAAAQRTYWLVTGRKPGEPRVVHAAGDMVDVVRLAQ